MKIRDSMPSMFSFYPEPPIYYRNNNMITILFRTNPEILKELVPSPLIPNSNNLAFVYVGDFHMDVPIAGKYREAGLGVPVTFKETVGDFYVSLYLDSALAITAGREIWGWPKKDAEITYSVSRGVVQVSVSRGGISLISASVNEMEQVIPVPHEPDTLAFNLKIVPSVKKNHPPDVFQLTSAITVSKKKELIRGTATLTFESSVTDPLGRIPIIEVLSGEHSIEDLTLDYGEVLFDYLAENQSVTGD